MANQLEVHPQVNYVEGKVIAVTGAGGGFGSLICRMCAALGASIVAADVNETAIEELVSEINAAGGQAVSRFADVTDRASMAAMVEMAVERFGHLDVIVNNAGVMPLAFYSDHVIAADAWDRCIDINLKGVLNGITASYDQMIVQGRGHVINISSIYGNVPNAGAAVYSATKAAVNVLSEALRVESQGKIKVTIIKPTGVPATNLGASVVNGEAIIGILGHRLGDFGEHIMQSLTGTLPAELSDPNSIKYWSIAPEQIAEAVVHVINQPWGVSISDITVRASGEEYLL